MASRQHLWCLLAFLVAAVDQIRAQNETTETTVLVGDNSLRDVSDPLPAIRSNLTTSPGMIRVPLEHGNKAPKSDVINIVSSIVGWCYFICWSVSFYPQLWTNYKRKSVVGLNFDFLSLNMTGFVSLAIFYGSLYFVPYIQFLYEKKYAQANIPVAINDVVFASHASFATAITIFQCCIYEKGNQTVSLAARLFVVSVITGALILLISCAADMISWLTYLYYFSYIKLMITFLKYIPQAWFNYKRESTHGWSIGTVIFDFNGGWLSITQMLLLAYNYDDWISLFTNFTKFGLALVSIVFDIFFMIQHYVLYREVTKSELTCLTATINHKAHYKATMARL